MGITDDLKNQFKQGNTLIKIIYVNVILFVAINLVLLVAYLLNISPDSIGIANWLMVPASLENLITRPWTLFTYMFFHIDFLHIIFNLLWLFWFGKIFLEYIDQKRLLNVYILGGLTGAFVYILAYNIFPVFESSLQQSFALGASASVLAIVIAISFYVPNYTIQLLFFGSIKLKYIGFFTILIDILSIRIGNPGGHFAHLGGALYGYIFITQYRKGNDITQWYSKVSESLLSFLKPRKKMKVSYKRSPSDYEYNKQKQDIQKEIDSILDKIAKGGYDSLSTKEKDFLFRSGKD